MITLGHTPGGHVLRCGGRCRFHFNSVIPTGAEGPAVPGLSFDSMLKTPPKRAWTGHPQDQLRYFTNSQRSPVITRLAVSEGFDASAVAMLGYAVFISWEFAHSGTFAIL